MDSVKTTIKIGYLHEVSFQIPGPGTRGSLQKRAVPCGLSTEPVLGQDFSSFSHDSRNFLKECCKAPAIFREQRKQESQGLPSANSQPLRLIQGDSWVSTLKSLQLRVDDETPVHPSEGAQPALGSSMMQTRGRMEM